MPLDWDADTYARVGCGIHALGHEVLERTELSGHEVVLDAGCGSGELTAELANRVPRGRVYAVDASPRMVELARSRLNTDIGVRPQCRVWQQDLLDLEVPEPVDLIFSAATFHWIADHDRLFARLYAALRPGGRLVAQCGGAGNIAAIRAAIEEVSGEIQGGPAFGGHVAASGTPRWTPWNFATPQETEARLRAAGFAEARAWLYERPVESNEPLAFLKTAILGEHLERLPETERDPFAQAVLDRLDKPFIARYVRLNMEANAGA
jgi:trans-aconitate 2-methyltransferase